MHEHEIRKPEGEYGFLKDEGRRREFLTDVERFVRDSPFVLIASVILKEELQNQYVRPANPYDVGLAFGLERAFLCLKDLGQAGRITHVVVERRGPKEDGELELVFRRICDGVNFFNQRFPFSLVMASKLSNSPGLQLADPIARPVGIKTLRPDQENRAYAAIEGKFRRSPKGTIKGWGIKVFP